MNWNGIRFFIHIAEVGNVSVAANDLGIVQPALSRHVRRLEEELGAKLFERLPRGVQLTDDGKLFLERCRRMMREFMLAKADLAASREKPKGQVTFGLPGTLTQTLVPRLLDRLRARYPNIALRIVEGASQPLQERLIAGRLHASILSNPTSVSGVHITPMVAEQLVVVSSGRPAKARRYFTLAELVRTPMIVSVGMREMVDAQIREAGGKLTVEYEVDSVEAIRSVLLNGPATTILPVSTLRAEVEAGRVSVYPVSDINIHRTLAMTRRTGDLAPAVQAVIDVAQSEISELTLQGAFTAFPEPLSRPVPRRTTSRGAPRHRRAEPTVEPDQAETPIDRRKESP